MEDQDKWQMSFVMPSKHGSNLPLPKDPSVKIKEVPRKKVAVVAFSGQFSQPIGYMQILRILLLCFDVYMII